MTAAMHDIYSPFGFQIKQLSTCLRALEDLKEEIRSLRVINQRLKMGMHSMNPISITNQTASGDLATEGLMDSPTSIP